MTERWRNRLRDALCRLAGGQLDVLRQAPADRTRYVANGAALLATAGLAVVSATFALTTTLHAPLPAALAVGLGWGLLVLVIDRMLVVGMVRPTGVSGWTHMAVTVLVRFAMAIVIGVVVSTPLVLRVFQPEIDSELRVMQADAASAAQRQLDSDARFAGLPALRETIAAEQAVVDAGPAAVTDGDADVRRARQELAAAQAAYETAQQGVVCEKEGTCGSGVRGAGIAFREKVQIRDQAGRTLEQARAELAAAVRTATTRSLAQSRNTVASTRERLAADQATLARLATEKAAVESGQQRAIDASDGILERLRALQRIGDRDSALLLAHLFIALLFLVVEVLPVVTKTLQITGRRSLYEKLVEAQEQDTLFAATHAARTRRRIDRIRSRVAESSETDLARRRIHANREVNAVVVDTQREVTDRALAAWAEDVSTRTVDEIANWVPARRTRIVDLR
jgi:hypothetical protein